MKEREPSTASSSSFRTIPSSSSSSSTSSDSSDSEDPRLLLLYAVRVIQDLLENVDITEEPSIAILKGDEPTVEPKSSNKVMGLYRTMSATFSGIRSPSSPEWFLLTAFVLNGIPTHYTVWKERRDVILQSNRLLNSTLDVLISDMERKNQKIPQNVNAVASEWLPSRKDLESTNGIFSNWRAVCWELNAVKCFNLRYQKNFQVWHHRREMLEVTLKQIEPSLCSTVLASMDSFSQFLRTHHNMEFSQIDERIISGLALEMDGKNYHVWLHRAWFIRAFSFLVSPPSWEALRQLPFGFIKSTGNNVNKFFENFAVKEEWEQLSLTPTVPPCALNEELLYTANLIKSDCLNNSAWCHRFSLFNHDLIYTLMQTSSSVSIQELKEVLHYLCGEELHFALQWCVYNPSNESSFVHARSITVIYQATSLRLLLSNAISEETGYHYLNDEGPIIGSKPLSSHYLSLKKHVSWEDYLNSFSLLQQQLLVLQEVVVPRVDKLYIRTAARDEETVNILHSTFSQFLIDNLHQVYAAIYHSLFVMLEQIWCCYFTEEERNQIHKLLPSNTYIEGIAAVTAQLIQKPIEGCVKFFLESELQAMQLARNLVDKDSIRSKYWKHEIRIIMHRQYGN
ncbi:protein farnesyltransferase alpha subunit [Trypanosoma theileri]|uniref:Protein farnesyltransferase/geranylgeranyltransferase type-1 subunit alpha n=1 Tax=Trypanosoma theileri TaxID=67003 RepID=A0A1X0P015_9TRYP|nr:protein farnesyltransferase alpha subunit [Trypanosoma theileri]ORC90265.1 protein farnesyltransferase alpha subunit [Trypanosoma theileri]